MDISVLDEERTWALLLALADRARSGTAVTGGSFRLDERGSLEEVPPAKAWLSVGPSTQRGFETREPVSPAVDELLEMYLHLCVGRTGSKFVLAHLGQSIDGQIATQGGASRYVTGPENLRHVHRLRALADAIVVGATTVECDDPALTTRLVRGPSPTRVVIDPTLRLRGDRRVFGNGAAPTLLVCSVRENGQPTGRADRVEIGARDGILPPSDILAALSARGLRRIFIEGGGITVSRFLEARAIDRLQIAVGPLLIGRGRPGIALPPIEELGSALRPATRRFQQGEDVLFDCSFDGTR
jgi:diaminohydroxyphosphoribosylaminopyrimidine deaminase / 5-amino-6-(5-phosphoribosylamino)uracil reductase